ncbi:hypothetical protein ADUPG1_011341, partial [Aduncisulcus paluster]
RETKRKVNGVEEVVRAGYGAISETVHDGWSGDISHQQTDAEIRRREREKGKGGFVGQSGGSSSEQAQSSISGHQPTFPGDKSQRSTTNVDGSVSAKEDQSISQGKNGGTSGVSHDGNTTSDSLRGSLVPENSGTEMSSTFPGSDKPLTQSEFIVKCGEEEEKLELEEDKAYNELEERRRKRRQELMAREDEMFRTRLSLADKNRERERIIQEHREREAAIERQIDDEVSMQRQLLANKLDARRKRVMLRLKRHQDESIRNAELQKKKEEEELRKEHQKEEAKEILNDFLETSKAKGKTEIKSLLALHKSVIKKASDGERSALSKIAKEDVKDFEQQLKDNMKEQQIANTQMIKAVVKKKEVERALKILDEKRKAVEQRQEDERNEMDAMESEERAREEAKLEDELETAGVNAHNTLNEQLKVALSEAGNAKERERLIAIHKSRMEQVENNIDLERRKQREALEAKLSRRREQRKTAQIAKHESELNGILDRKAKAISLHNSLQTDEAAAKAKLHSLKEVEKKRAELRAKLTDELKRLLEENRQKQKEEEEAKKAEESRGRRGRGRGRRDRDKAGDKAGELSEQDLLKQKERMKEIQAK